MGCATSLVKIIVFIFNFIFALCGLALLIVGILMVKHVKDYSDFLNGKFSAPPILLIVVGSIIFVVSFFGFCGAIRESNCMLCTYVVLLLLIFIVQVVAAGLAFAYKDDTEDILFQRIEIYVKNYDNHKEAVDSLQRNLKCCGAVGVGDYPVIGSPSLINLPKSCCDEDVNDCSALHLTSFYSRGCIEALKDFIESQGNIIGGIAIGIAVVEITGIIFGLCLANSIKNAERRGGA